MNKTDIKNVKCHECNRPIEVPKWASNKQQCDLCIERQKKPRTEIDRQNPEEPIYQRPVDKARHAQATLDALGFTITHGGRWFKQYSDGDAIIRLEPYFERGTSVDSGYALEGFTVLRQEFVSITDKDLNIKVASVTHQDITTLLQELEMKVPGVALTQQHVDTVICSKCGDKTSSWIGMLSSKENLCIDRCAPAKIKHT